MKKIFALFAALFCVAGYVFAEDVDDLLKSPVNQTQEQVIIPEDMHIEMHPRAGEKAQVQFVFAPAIEEMRYYYVCPNNSFEEGEARRTILACLEDFQKKNGYYSYKYMAKEETHYFRDKNKIVNARYEGRVKFLR
ncbi:MAG: hypothetical protein K6G80_01215 [Treponema sp.]|nr:hypothetical protein [Treponema sp.]